MSPLPPCPKCQSTLTYSDGSLFVCPECAHEWSASDAAAAAEAPAGSADQEPEVRDANGNVLKNGDTVLLIKDLPVKGSASALKSGTKVKNIRLVDGDHNIDCRIEDFGGMRLKSEFVRKV